MNQVFQNNIDVAINKQALSILENDEVRVKLEKRMLKLLIMKQCTHNWKESGNSKNFTEYKCTKCEAMHTEYSSVY